MASLRIGGESRVQTERRLSRWAASTLATLLACAACGGSDEPSTTGTGAPTSSAAPSPIATSGSAEPTRPTGPATTPATTAAGPPAPPPATSGSAVTVIPDQQDRVEFARRDVSERFGYPVAEIEVVIVESVVWPNEAAGCPSTGREYEPDPTPGYRIVLAWADLTFSYHGVDGDREPVLCQFLD